ncbi:MAG: VCBS repeat-containing protein [Bacteroidetes bacterium SW_4_67_19]|nr:MAG: VCBS repeat-containing protein [Bacteroidetes bacterium SW_4_67_19]
MSTPPAERHPPAPPYPRTPALLILILLAAGCAGSERATAPADSNDGASAENQRYARRVTPFPVQSAGGDAYDVPFLGGFNVPRPQIIDINGDGARDLFIQEESGQVMFFENTASAGAPARFAWRSSDYRDLAVGEWYRFVDLDGDGLLDLLAEQPYSYLRYYHNTGSDGDPRFELAKDTLRTVGGEPLFSDRQNIPNVADVDCDGKPDLFVGRLDGTVTRYEATGEVGPEDVPQFRLVNENFAGIEIVQQFGPGGQPTQQRPVPGRSGSGDPLGGSNDDGPPGGGPRTRNAKPATGNPSAKHGANTMAFADADGDGDQDLLWGDYFEPGLLLLENRGGCETLDFSNDPVPFPRGNPLSTTGYNAPAIGDLTGDGLQDLLIGVIGGAYNPDRTAANNLYFYERTTAGGSYALRARQYLSMIDVGLESVPALADLDDDGDQDLLVGSKIGTAKGSTEGPVLRYENTGGPADPRFRLADTLALAPEAYNRAPALADLDDDGDPDLVMGTWNNSLRYHENTGTASDPQFAETGTVLAELGRGSHPAPAFADLDGDGDLDLVLGETAGSLTFFRNTGTPQQPQFQRENGLLKGASVDRRSAPVFHDVDGDGDQDLVVGSEGAGIALFRNEGSARDPRFVRAEKAGPFALVEDAPELAAPDFADIDGDGDADLFIGAARGGLMFFEDKR